MYKRKILNIAPINLELQEELTKALKISKIMANILINRGIKDIEEAERFLNPKLNYLLSSYLFSEMPKAVNLIKKAVKDKFKVMIFGDYDADGLTSLAILKETLSRMGLEVIYYLPHRIKEGYGLNRNIIEFAKQKNVKVLITADCGTNDYEQIEQLRKDNIEVIITDHHQPKDETRPSTASAILNPKLKESGYPYKDLAGVGVVYKFCQALSEEDLFDKLELVCLGTVADAVPLLSENRVMVKEGLLRLAQTNHPGLKALKKKSRLKNMRLDTESISYILGPRINASGRLDTAQTSLDLLLSQDEEEADRLAERLELYNRQRQKIENQILEEAHSLIEKEINFNEDKVIVLAKENWHQGVLGIVASKIVDRFHRPAIVISKTPGLCRGSGRSIKNFHLFQALLECKEFLSTFGGHSHAAGLLIAEDKIFDFKDTINRLANEWLSGEDLIPSLDIDMEIKLSDLNESLAKELESLQPYGVGNPQVLFYTRGLSLKSKPQILGKDTIKLWVTDGMVTYPAIGFGMECLNTYLLNADSLDLVYTVGLDVWEDRTDLLLEIKEIFFR
ncbi:MAG: single-stranded-DNA-specific exonuclease RecJ [Candidatus Omnitrophica bacterium]|nr:single-stranded-DNA-specific exonuclease RecJ [Candidatus Omnitrophota bacterium]